MAVADLLARYVGGAALLVSAGSATVSVLSYRRSGSRAKANPGRQVLGAMEIGPSTPTAPAWPLIERIERLEVKG